MLDGGRIVVPAEVRAALGLKKGDRVTVTLAENGEVRLSTPMQVFQRLQELYRQHVPPGTDSLDDFIAFRRAEAVREERGE